MRIELEDVCKTYDGCRWVVRDLRFAVDPGRIVGLIGPNGAGKSTTLRMLATQLAPSRGTIRYDGVPPSERTLGEIRRRIGFLGDGHALYPDMTPREYLEFFGRCFGLDGDACRRAVEETLETFALSGKADTPTAALSKGMRQRLSLARCFLHAPEVLVVDEPADGLDPRGRIDLRRILRAAADGGASVVVSSHILRELDGLCDEVVILRDGRAEVIDVARSSSVHAASASRYRLRTTTVEPERVAAVAQAHDALVSEVIEAAPGLRVRLLWRRREADLADLVADLVAAGVPVCGLEREASELEELYDVVADDRVR
ncbi:MAG: ABC transporter ATP-binding protein [Deltaproteobacteria bacterium]|nr:MAG: ABC transporter ATP-binding protein [Deltaproteobacteria bacterium]